MNRLKEASSQFIALSARFDSTAPAFDEVAAGVHQLCASIHFALSSGIDESVIRRTLAESYTIHGQSPFIRRLQTWPRGYAGDFETIEGLIAGRNTADPGTIAYWLEFLALQSPLAQQHRNKVRWQAEQIRRALQRPSRPEVTNILVLASGSSPDIQLLQDEIHRSSCKIVLNDSDAEALAFSASTLSHIADKIEFVHGNVLGSISRLQSSGLFDLVLAGGLFDYLPNRHAEFLVRAINERLLATNGVFVFTNIASGNPSRIWIEYLANWKLIERTDQELGGLIERGFGPNANCELTKDTTGLTTLATVSKRQRDSVPWTTK